MTGEKKVALELKGQPSVLWGNPQSKVQILVHPLEHRTASRGVSVRVVVSGGGASRASCRAHLLGCTSSSLTPCESVWTIDTSFASLARTKQCKTRFGAWCATPSSLGLLAEAVWELLREKCPQIATPLGQGQSPVLSGLSPKHLIVVVSGFSKVFSQHCLKTKC